MTNGIKEISQMEEKIWQALASGDAAADAALLTEDFLGVYPSGFWNKEAHYSQLKDGPVIAQYRLSEQRLICLSETSALLIYRASFSWCSKPDKTEVMYISSLWNRFSGEWKNSFSQDTPAAGNEQ